uniref:Uncharacterized protein n=1 Tax=Spodoptera exigua multiple nucleopolyhedrovirus TaxID=10454 RepID=A0A6N0C2G8_9ABAC|nr:hypothetical protein [Spodoptera exigua multiple nucleopolyhedrovirus]
MKFLFKNMMQYFQLCCNIQCLRSSRILDESKDRVWSISIVFK